jgi:ribonucleoside-diphosphate reductase alpha chain
MVQPIIRVVKRNGKIENLDISKIQAFTSLSVDGLENVEQSELEVGAQLKFRDMISTEDIQHTLIQTAVDKIDIDAPNWTFVAARLFLYDLRHKVCGKNSYPHIREYFQQGESEQRIVKGLQDRYDLDILNDYIDISRDMQFNYLGVKTLYDRYLLKDKQNNIIELPQHMFMAIAMFLAQNEDDNMYWAKQFYDVLSKFEVMAATPTLSNARTPRHQLSSCYIGSTPDNIEGIFDAYKEMSLLSKYGGGIGWDFNKIRGLGSFIDNHKNAAGGVVPFLKIVNDIAIAVDQLGTRKGAIAVYLEIWHSDIKDFLDLKKNSGEERRRAHDLFPSLWICDLFMQRVQDDASWSLMDPYDVEDLSECYGREFEKKYIAYENDINIVKTTIKAKDLWKDVLRSYFETGNPFLCFKDNANHTHPNEHMGIIRSSNLCTEIFQHTQPNYYKTKVTYSDDSFDLFEQKDMIKTDVGIEKKASKITSLDSIDNKKVVFVEQEQIDGDTAVCNLASINLSKINTKEDIERVVPIAIRMLDNVIDLNFYPVKKTQQTNKKSRSIGLGVMGEAQMLAQKSIVWGESEHLEYIDNIMEMISYNAISSSCDLAKEKGSFPKFDGSNWSKGILPINVANKEALKLTNQDRVYKWDDLSIKVKNTGIRNGYLMAIAPTSSISILVGTTQTIEPIYSKKWFEENLSGLIPVVVPNLNSNTWEYYQSAYDIDQLNIIRAAAVRQKWIDQGQSTNIFVTLDKASGKYLNNIYSLAWKLGLKSTYYLRSQSPEATTHTNVVDRSIECEGCQ